MAKLKPLPSERICAIRCFAIWLILATHILQQMDNRAASVLNIGVQLFIVMSGFLLAQRETIRFGRWFRSRFARILPAFYLYLFVIPIPFLLIRGESIYDTYYWVHFTTLHWLYRVEYLDWNGHLWFITLIVLCYLLMPILHGLRSFPTAARLISQIMILPLALMIAAMSLGVPYRFVADITCFAAGVSIAHTWGPTPPTRLGICLIILSASLVGAIALLVGGDREGWLLEPSLITPWVRASAGVGLFLLMYKLLPSLSLNYRVIRAFDNISYELYLFHKPLVLGSLSLLSLTNWLSVNLLLAIVASVLLAAAGWGICRPITGWLSGSAKHGIAQKQQPSKVD